MEAFQTGSCGRGCSVAVKIAGIVALVIVLVVALAKDDIWYQSGNTIQVVGQGRVPVSPDAALVNFGVLVVRENTAQEAIQKSADSIARVNAALETAGIPKEDRQMTGYVVNPLYDNMYGPIYAATPDGTNVQPKESSVASLEKGITGYTASQQITVLIRSIAENDKRVNDVIAAATAAGANQVGEVRMVATNAEMLKQEARIKALADAREKAGNMAKTAGVKLKGITSWYENALATPGTQEPTNNVYASAQTASTYTPWGVAVLQPGQLDMVVEITVSYGVNE